VIKLLRIAVAAAMLLGAPLLSRATDFAGVQPAALDQPRINAYFTRTAGGVPLSVDLGGGQVSFNVEAFFDTGASGILLSNNTADLLDIQRIQHNGQEVIYSDIGVGGSSDFNVSETLHLGLAPYHPDADIDNPKTYSTVYNQNFGPVRTQIGPINVLNPDPNLEDLDVIGTPAMQGKVVVMDPKPVNTFLDTMRTYVYNPGTPFNASQASSNPGIPAVDRHIKLSYGDFSRFTTTTPAGAPTPTLRDNPFIGPNPVLQLDPNPPPDNTPPVKLAYGTHSTSGSFLLDTGAAASIISTAKASALGVTYDPATIGTDDPHLLGVPLDQQFQLTIGGTGGTTKIAGFFLDSMLVRTQEGNAANDADPNHLRFLEAPVLVSDISVQDPITHQSLTLDGIFGMNYLVASAFVTEAEPFPIIDNLTFGKFDWAVFDQPNGTLGVKLAPTTPQGGLSWFGGLFTDSNWDIGVSQTWLGGQSLTAYQDGDHVQFTDLTVDPTVTIVEPVAPGSVLINNSDEVDYAFHGAAIRGFTGLIKTGTGTVEFFNSNQYTGITDIQQGVLTFVAPQNIGPVNVQPEGFLWMESTQHFEELNISGGEARFTPNGNKVLVVQKLTVINNGKFDTDNNHIVIKDKTKTTPAELRAMLLSGRNGGAWNGPGIASARAASDPTHYALGMGDNASLGYTTFFGEPVDANALLVRFTRVADANLDGIVNLNDFNRLASNFGTTGKFWYQGDFNYDGLVGLADFNMMANNFGFVATGLENPTPQDWANLAAAVPEPSGICIWLAGAACLLARRYRVVAANLA
jgi:autotransporter-associated beta strand protein